MKVLATEPFLSTSISCLATASTPDLEPNGCCFYVLIILLLVTLNIIQCEKERGKKN